MYTPVLLTLFGCDAFNKVKDSIDGLLNPVVTQALVLGVEAPEEHELQALLEGSDFESGTVATVFIADATEVSDIENAPIRGAEIMLSGPSVDAQLDEIDAGTYALDPTTDLVTYAAGETWTIQVQRAKDGQIQESSATFELPGGADLAGQIPQVHQENTAITLDFSGQGFDSALVVVLDENGDATYSNEPSSIRELYDFTHSNTELTTFEIPGSAFPNQALYAVGVAGMKNSDAQDLTEMNTALSTVLYGTMNFTPITTIVPVP